ncbi:MAG: SHOCT domain-containing protein [Cyanobacteriota bacterium]
MEQITQEGLRVAEDLGQRHGFSSAAVVQLMQAMLRSGGGMVQFNHPELGGSGQWMAGGMVMIGDMFNNGLKARVDGLCRDVSTVLASQPLAGAALVGSMQQQSGGSWQQQSSTPPTAAAWPAAGAASEQRGPSAAAPLFVADPRDHWWPAELGMPSASGAQNNVRYAVFPNAGRLAVDVNGQVSVYDTGSHQIAGLAQQQGGGVVFTTSSGSVGLSSFSPAAGSSQQQQSSSGGFQQQHSSSGGGFQQQHSSGGVGAAASMPPTMTMTPMAPMSSMAPLTPMAPQKRWWPEQLGMPAASGAQNAVEYAVFPEQRRLALLQGERCRLFVLGDQPVLGVSAQGSSGALMLLTAEGEQPLAGLEELDAAVEPSGTLTTDAAENSFTGTHGADSPTAGSPGAVSSGDDPYAALERLGALKTKGILTEEEFSAKKAELLARL